MEIYINNHSIDFEMEAESTVHEVVDSLLDWSKERDLVFSEVVLDGENYSVDKIPDMPVEKASQMNCLIESKADIVISSVDAGIRYCEKARTFIEEISSDDSETAEELEHLEGGLHWISDVLISVVKLIGADPDEAQYRDETITEHVAHAVGLGDFIADSGNLEESVARVKQDVQIFADIREIFRLLLASDEMRSLIAKSIDSPDTLLASLVEIKNAIPGEVENLKAAAIAFQEGKDKDGVEKLNRFIAFIYAYTRSCYQVVPVFSVDLKDISGDGEESLETQNLQLQDLLSEVEEVMENDDIISLSDILEYELVPVLEKLEVLTGNLLDYLDR